MREDRVPLFVRLPREQATALDQMVSTTGQRKQQLVSNLLADRLQLGHVEIHEDPPTSGEVLTVAEVAELLRVAPNAVLELAQAGELPGRQLAGEWRFVRAAVLGWLSGGAPGEPRHKAGGDGR
jgi:excisionase family DNA binding protein